MQCAMCSEQCIVCTMKRAVCSVVQCAAISVQDVQAVRCRAHSEAQGCDGIQLFTRSGPLALFRVEGIKCTTILLKISLIVARTES